MQITRAETVTIGRATVTIRNPVAVWILCFVTLGIWTVVWTYQVTRELRDYSRAVTRPFAASPTVAALLAALWPLALFPGMIGAFVMGRRVRRAQSWVEVTGGVVAVLAAILFPLLFLHTLYLQRALNEVWGLAGRGHGPPPDYTVARGEGARIAGQAEQDALQRHARYR